MAGGGRQGAVPQQARSCCRQFFWNALLAGRQDGDVAIPERDVRTERRRQSFWTALLAGGEEGEVAIPERDGRSVGGRRQFFWNALLAGGRMAMWRSPSAMSGAWGGGSGRRRVHHEDAEGMSGEVGVYAQWLPGIVGAVIEQPGAERQGPLVLDVEVRCRRHRH